MRAVYVPTPVVSEGAAYLVVTARTTERGGTLICPAAVRSAPCVTLRLTPEHLRQVLRQWATADRAGHGLLKIED